METYWNTASGRRIVIDLIKFTILALLLITPFRFFVAQPFIVSGASMEPTLEAHEYLVIDQLTYRFNKPARGDVVIFRYPMDPSVFFIKRVIGLPGETVEMHNGLVTITSKDALHRVVLAEPYASETVRGESAAITLEDDEYFVLGDNREESSDSRTWGPLHERYIVGRALVRLFPFTDMSMFPGKYVFSNEGFE